MRLLRRPEALVGAHRPYQGAGEMPPERSASPQLQRAQPASAFLSHLTSLISGPTLCKSRTQGENAELVCRFFFFSNLGIKKDIVAADKGHPSLSSLPS